MVGSKMQQDDQETGRSDVGLHFSDGKTDHHAGQPLPGLLLVGLQFHPAGISKRWANTNHAGHAEPVTSKARQNIVFLLRVSLAKYCVPSTVSDALHKDFILTSQKPPEEMLTLPAFYR